MSHRDRADSGLLCGPRAASLPPNYREPQATGRIFCREERLKNLAYQIRIDPHTRVTDAETDVHGWTMALQLHPPLHPALDLFPAR